MHCTPQQDTATTGVDGSIVGHLDYDGWEEPDASTWRPLLLPAS